MITERSTKAEILRAYNTLKTDLEADARQLTEFKAEVANKAMELAKEHGWCEVVHEALAELGIAQKGNTTLTIQIEIRDETRHYIEEALETDLDDVSSGYVGLDTYVLANFIRDSADSAVLSGVEFKKKA